MAARRHDVDDALYKVAPLYLSRIGIVRNNSSLHERGNNLGTAVREPTKHTLSTT